MKIIAAPIEMVAKFDKLGKPKPARFLYNNHVTDVHQVISSSEEKLAGNRMKIFFSHSEIDGDL